MEVAVKTSKGSEDDEDEEEEEKKINHGSAQTAVRPSARARAQHTLARDTHAMRALLF